MTVFEIRTELNPAEVLDGAQEFFLNTGSSCAAYLEARAEDYIRLRMEVGEIVIGASTQDGYTQVRASASRHTGMLSRFLGSIGPLYDLKETTQRRAIRPPASPDSREAAGAETPGTDGKTSGRRHAA